MDHITRDLQSHIEARLLPGKAVLIFGARRVGKTILLKEIVKKQEGKSILLNGEDIDVHNMLQNRSVSNYRQLFAGTSLLAIDEAQNIPEIGKIIKLIVDEIEGIKVIATGSSSFDLLNKTGEPLVGRATQFVLTPFSVKEISQSQNGVEIRQNLENRLIYGCYPEVVGMTTNSMKEEYLREIVNAYLLKDILAIDGLRNSAKMQRLLQLVAYQMGSEVSYDELGKQLGMHRETVEKYLDLLSKVFVVYKIGAFSRNMRKEVSKAGKWYFYDNGIRNAIIGDFKGANNRLDMGELWENFFITEKMKENQNHLLHQQLHFWRTYDQQEIDLIVDSGTSLEAYEMKWGKKAPKTPSGFAKAYPEAAFHVVNPQNYLELL
ncbi:MAG: ATP-binding protein [Bacteroidales bacterium]|nr:ATP-binding protein [Bacteroidales bacterium]